jgi:hypothetical protein
MAKTEIDVREEQKFEWDKPVDERHTFKLIRYHGYRLLAEDLHFNHNSAVFQTDYEMADTQVSAKQHVTGLAVMKTCFDHANENPSRKMIICGHADTSGSDAYNLELSRLRADSVLHALLGERTLWVDIALKKSRIEDYQQLLKWVSHNWGWTCDPGKVDGRAGEMTEHAVRSFQKMYNKEFEKSISVDGAVGKQTWGAFFDMYMKDLQVVMETDEGGLKQLRAGLEFVDEGAKAVGCGENFPAYGGERNRRVEILFFDPDQVPKSGQYPTRDVCDRKKCLIYNPLVYRYEPIPCEPVPALTWCDLQTVDEFGCAVPNAELKLKPEYGKEQTIKTSDKGYWGDRIRADGKIEVRTADGKPVRFGASPPSEGEPEGRETATIVPRIASRTVTDIVVPKLSEELVAQKKKLAKRYGRTPTGQRRSMRSVEPVQHDGEPEGETSNRGGKVAKVSRRTVGRAVADNLFIAAGWQRDWLDNLWKHLRTWLRDRHPTAIARGYFVELIVGQSLLFLKESGENHTTVSHFNLMPDVYVKGRMGAHASFEFLGAADSTLFVDMNSVATGLVKGSFKSDAEKEKANKEKPPQEESDDQAGEKGRGSEDNPPGGESSPFELWEVVKPGEREQCRRVVYGLLAERQVEIAFKFPTFGEGLIYLARCGGTGLLEDYPGHESLNASIHVRNLAVAENIGKAYEAYASDYIKKVNAIDPDVKKAEKNKLPHPEVQLYELGPPDSSFKFPKPAGATVSHYREILNVCDITMEFFAWNAISKKLDQIWKVQSEGSIWIDFEFAAEAGTALGGCTVKLNFKVHDDGRVEKLNYTRTVSLKAQKGDSGLTFEVDPQTGKTVSKANLKLGKYGMEVDSNGNAKFSYGLAFSEYNNVTNQVGAGVDISLKGLIMDHYQKTNQDPPRWARMMPDLKFKMGVYMQLIHEGTILKIVSGAPGFWQMRPRSQFVTLDWDSLDSDEQNHLEQLGWSKKQWDSKSLPPSASNYFKDLSAEEKQAAIHLPVPSADDYWREFWKGDFMKAQRTN